MNDQETLERMGRDNGFLNITRDQQAACLAGAAAIPESKRLAARVAELEADKARLAVEVDSMRQQAEQARKDRDEATMEAAEAVLGAEAERDRIRELLLEAQSGGDAFRAPQDWWARVALAGPAPEGGAK